jgi:hypothetical protein
MIRTPSNLELLLHCYVSPAPHPRLRAPSIQEGLAYLATQGMVEQTSDEGVFETTDKGRAYIEHLMKVPFPVQYWAIEKD